eukprot:192148_1
MSHGLTLFVLISTIIPYTTGAAKNPLPGQSFILAGYDYIKGNPMEWGKIDQGYQDDVFNGVINGSSQPISFGDGQQYYKYFGVSGECGLQCGGIDQYASVTGIEEYYKLYTMLYQHVSMTKHGLFKSFAMSETYKKINEAIQINKNVGANTFQVCQLCSLRIDGYNAGPPFSEEFLNAVKQMPSNNNNNDWFYNKNLKKQIIFILLLLQLTHIIWVHRYQKI